MYLLDTNVISEMIKQNPDQGVMENLELHEGQLATASPVWHELNFGFSRLPDSKRKQQIGIFLSQVILPNLDILPYDDKAAVRHARERARLSKAGQTPPFVDGQIAGIAIVNNMTLVTRNVRDFDCFTGLVIENWHRF